MSAYLEDTFAVVRAAIAATWTDAPAGGIWESENAEMIPWDDMAPPYAVMLVEEMPLAPEWGLNVIAYAPDVQILYVAEVDGDSDNIRAKLEALRDYLLVTGLPGGSYGQQVHDVTGLSWSEDLEVNQVFAARNYSHRAGRLVVKVLVGEVVTV